LFLNVKNIAMLLCCRHRKTGLRYSKYLFWGFNRNSGYASVPVQK